MPTLHKKRGFNHVNSTYMCIDIDSRRVIMVSAGGISKNMTVKALYANSDPLLLGPTNITLSVVSADSQQGDKKTTHTHTHYTIKYCATTKMAR